jgi:thymidylate synthase ThyX
MEFSGRSCYNSTKQLNSRNSKDYHAHINDSGHSSVQEHSVIAVQFDVSTNAIASMFAACANRPGVFIEAEFGVDSQYVYVIANIRAIREWQTFTPKWKNGLGWHQSNSMIESSLISEAKVNAPLAMFDIPDIDQALLKHTGAYQLSFGTYNKDCPAILHPYITHSFFINGISRNLTHELIRHKFQTAVSQRSTRYVDESESAFIQHPLELQYGVGGLSHDIERISREAYKDTYQYLYGKQIAKGVDPHTARKQARGAARGYLLSSLETQLVFTATAAQWQRIFAQRNHPSADAEIQQLAEAVSKEINLDPNSK